MIKLKYFFWYCSGSNRQLLQKCPTDASKYVSIGASVFFTGLFAMIASGYAIFTFTDSYVHSIFLGVLWGIMIFNLDRFIVSGMRKTGNKKNEWLMASPRIVLALLISVVISRPLELKIFEKEIETELSLINTEIKEEQIAKLELRAKKEINLLKRENLSLDSITAQKERLRNQLTEIARKEADGTGGSLERNAGPIYKIKKADADKVEEELGTLRLQNNQIIAANLIRIDSFWVQLSAKIKALENPNYTGLAARLEALSRISKKSTAIRLANWFIILLFIAIETVPVFVKLVSYKGPYDYLLAQEEHGFETDWLEFVANANKATRKKVQRANSEERDYVHEQLNIKLGG